MNDPTLSSNVKMKNQLELWLFCAIIGAVAGALVWLILKIMAVGMTFLWEWIPERISFPFYTIAVCVIGAFIVGLFRKKYGDYPEDLESVIAKVKTEKRYEYKNMLVMIIAALLPLLMGSSVGPEAGLTGIIVGLCCWAGENLKFARHHAKEYSRIGIAVSLSVLFHAPLFGIFEVEEDQDVEIPKLTKGSRIFIYGIALASGIGIYSGLSALFGAGLSGFPSFDMVGLNRTDYLLIVVYILCGCLLALFYKGTHALTGHAATKIPPVLREVVAGLILGIIGIFLPAILFSGEEQLGILIDDYAKYLPIALIGIAFLKIMLTNLCIQFGLKGGHFFPVIFAGVCMGYGVALFICGPTGGHTVFAAAVVTATLLGCIMKKPIAVTMLLFLCFPVKMFFWIFVAAVIGSKLFSIRKTADRSPE